MPIWITTVLGGVKLHAAPSGRCLQIEGVVNAREMGLRDTGKEFPKAANSIRRK